MQVKKNINLREITAEDFAAYSKKEAENSLFNTEVLASITEKSWQVFYNDEPVLLIGVVTQTFLGTVPELWVITYKKLEEFPVLLKVLKRTFPLVTDEYKNLRVKVKSSFTSGCRFAEFFGFKKISENPEYINYELRT